MNTIELVAEIDEATVLRPPCSEDVEAIWKCVDENRSYLRRWLGWVDDCTSSQEIAAFVNRVRESHQEGMGLSALIIHEDAVGGVISLDSIDWINFSAAIGYWLREDLQGQGLMTRACGAMLDHMFTQLNLHRAEIRCATENVKSQSIPRRLGFTYEGTLREAGRLEEDRYVDLMVFSLLEQTWRNSEF